MEPSSATLRPGQMGGEVEKIPVPISYDIIRLFSEGLYKSPHKAIEELVTNGYDADARAVHVVLPDENSDANSGPARLWVIDDGHGMDEAGFHKLWRIARSDKADAPSDGDRPPIGQFGIGKLAAYVVARNLLHVSLVEGRLLLTEMDFRKVEEVELADKPVKISLREIDEDDAKALLADIRGRDPAAWRLMFGDDCVPRWTVAGLSDFRDLYSRLAPRTLRWVLMTGLPLHSDFRVHLDREPLESSKATRETIGSKTIREDLPGIGTIRGRAQIFKEKLTGGKSEQYGRSHGFFVRVRGRVINLEDELFGLKAVNHAAWSRFALDIEADGLRDHLLSSREGVKDSEHVRGFRQVLLNAFNECRAAYDKFKNEENKGLDIAQLLSDGPRVEIAEPIVQTVRGAVGASCESFYVGLPAPAQAGSEDWLEEYEADTYEEPIAGAEFVKEGSNAPALRYDPVSRTLFVNSEHPFVDKLTVGAKGRVAAKMFAASEVVLEGQLSLQGVGRQTIAELLVARDRVLRVMAGEAPATATEVLRRLRAAYDSEEAFEVAVGAAFRALRFRYERKGGNRPGPDGVLYARLGRHDESSADYSLVYDAKTTEKSAVPADKVQFDSLERFRLQKGATFGCFVADVYAGEQSSASTLNENLRASRSSRLSLLKTAHLESLVRMHYNYGLTLTDLRGLFEEAHTVPEVDGWIEGLEARCSRQEIPLQVLLDGLEKAKEDAKAKPNIIAVREKVDSLKEFEPEHLRARLRAVEALLGPRWLTVKEDYTVRMHSDSGQLLSELDRAVRELPEPALAGGMTAEKE